MNEALAWRVSSEKRKYLTQLDPHVACQRAWLKVWQENLAGQPVNTVNDETGNVGDSALFTESTIAMFPRAGETDGFRLPRPSGKSSMYTH